MSQRIGCYLSAGEYEMGNKWESIRWEMDQGCFCVPSLRRVQYYEPNKSYNLEMPIAASPLFPPRKQIRALGK
jgi:hypothetical protein